MGTPKVNRMTVGVIGGTPRRKTKGAERSSVNQSLTANDNPIDRTCEVWEPRLGRDVSREDAWEIAAECLSGFFSIRVVARRDARSGERSDRASYLARRSAP
jgi:hypothetical protein